MVGYNGWLSLFTFALPGRCHQFAILLGWTTELETGIELLDEQHHRYVDLLNDYLKKVSEHSGTDEKTNRLTASFDSLRQYAKDHFVTEESIMKDEDYPDYLPHLEEHLYFLHHVDELYKKMKTQGFSPELSREVNFYTVEWFVEHILETDMKLVEFLNCKHETIPVSAEIGSTEYFEPQPDSPGLGHGLH